MKKITLSLTLLFLLAPSLISANVNSSICDLETNNLKSVLDLKVKDSNKLFIFTLNLACAKFDTNYLKLAVDYYMFQVNRSFDKHDSANTSLSNKIIEFKSNYKDVFNKISTYQLSKDEKNKAIEHLSSRLFHLLIEVGNSATKVKQTKIHMSKVIDLINLLEEDQIEKEYQRIGFESEIEAIQMQEQLISDSTSNIGSIKEYKGIFASYISELQKISQLVSELQNI